MKAFVPQHHVDKRNDLERDLLLCSPMHLLPLEGYEVDSSIDSRGERIDPVHRDPQTRTDVYVAPNFVSPHLQGWEDHAFHDRTGPGITARRGLAFSLHPRERRPLAHV